MQKRKDKKDTELHGEDTELHREFLSSTNDKRQTANETCPLCDRELAPPCTKHHLIPISKGGKHTETVLLHKICHDKIHSVISEKELMKNYNTINKLKTHPELIKFIEWVSKKPPAFYDVSKRKKK